MKSAKKQTVYVALLDEGLDVWRPTEAEQLPNGSYRILATPDYDAEDEKWEFPPGSHVICQKRRISTGEVLAAVRRAQSARKSA